MADQTPEIPGLLRTVTTFFADALEWLVATFEDPVISAAIRADLGLGNDAAAPPPIDDDRLAGIRAFTQHANPDAESFAQVVEDVVAVSGALGGWIEALRDDDSDTDEILYLLLTMGATERLRIRSPVAWALAETVVVLHEVFGAAPGVDESALGTVLQPLFDLLRLLLAIETGLDVAPERKLDQQYATRISNLVSIAMVYVANETGLADQLEASYGWDHPVPASATPVADELSQHVLTVVYNGEEDAAGVNPSLTGVLVPVEHGGPGMVLSLGGQLELEHLVARPPRVPLPEGSPTPAWVYRIELAGGGLGLFIPFTRDGDAPVSTDLAAAVSVGVRPVLLDPPEVPDGPVKTRPAPRGVPAFRIGLFGSTFLEIGAFEGGVEFGPDRARVELVLRDIDLVVKLTDADQFLSTQGDRDVLFGFDLAIIADTATGLSFGGGSGFHVAIPVSRSVFGVFVAHHVEVEIVPSEERDVALVVAGTFGLRLGPFTAVVQGIGFRLDVGFESGNLGLLDVDVGFHPPTGIGLALDVGDFKGGGFLFLDAPRGEYAGVLELTAGPVTFKAIGILTTKLPGGAHGWSLLIMLFGEFKPIPIGFGFTLTGLGGMIGIQHGVSGDALRSGLRTGVLDDVLFPKDPVADAPRLLNQMRTVFPITPRAFTFGPFVRIGYGKPAFLTIQLGLVFQLDNVFRAQDRDVELTRLMLVGQMKVEIPPAEKRPASTPVLVKIVVDILGDFDFQAQSMAIDARLRDSKISGMTLTGSWIVRARWGSERSWILAAGGFHPEFKDLPSGVPKQDRLGLSLKKGIATVKFECYMAWTSNTFQIGARVFAQAKKWGFTVEGWLGFDALFTFDPPRFRADIEAGVALKKGSRTLMGVDLRLTIQGPGRWRLAGSAKFKVLFVSKTIRFDESWGSDPALPAVTVDTEAEIARALSDPGNWSAALPAGGDMLVSLRSSSSGVPDTDTAVPAHPLGALTGLQRVVPLDVEVDRVGGALPANARRFSITHVELGGAAVDEGGNQAAVTRSVVDEHFATAQFLDLTEDEKLSTPSFERYPAGVAIAAETVTVPAAHVSATLDFETIHLPREPVAPEPVRTLDIAVLVAQAGGGAAARSQLRRRRFLAGAPTTPVTVVEPRHVAVLRRTHDPIDATVTGTRTQLRQSVRGAEVGAAAGARVVVEQWELGEEVVVP